MGTPRRIGDKRLHHAAPPRGAVRRARPLSAQLARIARADGIALPLLLAALLLR
jgi:hypothetical protein